MSDETPRSGIISMARQAVRWRARSNRQIWLIYLALVIMTCTEAILLPSKRQVLPYMVIGLLATAWWSTESRRSRREREALAARLASTPRDDIPADVTDLVAAGKKVQAIKRYRALTGAGLRDAKNVIDGL
ncbi:MAG TPA: hypothetical protein VMA73_26785 [Streptosporangiaceae bacterium]|nr:hypothetical protein [Streptosporangiaceae bacterium]